MFSMGVGAAEEGEGEEVEEERRESARLEMLAKAVEVGVADDAGVEAGSREGADVGVDDSKADSAGGEWGDLGWVEAGVTSNDWSG